MDSQVLVTLLPDISHVGALLFAGYLACRMGVVGPHNMEGMKTFLESVCAPALTFHKLVCKWAHKMRCDQRVHGGAVMGRHKFMMSICLTVCLSVPGIIPSQATFKKGVVCLPFLASFLASRAVIIALLIAFTFFLDSRSQGPYRYADATLRGRGRGG